MIHASVRLCILAAAITWCAPALGKKIVLKIATVAPEGSPWASALLKYRKKLHKISGKRIKVKLFLGGSLGDENESVLACKRGQVQAVGVSTGAMATLVPELAALELPYLFRSAKEADKVLDHPEVMARMEQLLGDRGFTILLKSENGFRSFGTKDGFVKSPADLSGKKMRSQENVAHIAMYKALGASPVPVAVTEVLTALQTGNVDGFDNTALFAQAASWHNGIKYFTVSNHIYQPALVAVRKEWLDGLPEDLRQAVFDARGDLERKLRRQLRRMVKYLLKNFEEQGIQVYKLTKKEKKAFQALAPAAHQEFLSSAGESTKAFYDLVVKTLRAIRGE